MICLKKINYIPAQEVIDNCPVWCKGVRSGRDLIKKKDIVEGDFIYAKLIDGEWVKSDGNSMKFDKVFIKEQYLLGCEEYVDETGDGCYDIIELTDDEKMRNEAGDIFEIEVRGTKSHDGIYFKAKDVANLLQMKSLIKTLKDPRNEFSYKEDVDYICILCGDSTTSDVFLTYIGMLRVFFVSRNANVQNFIGWLTKLIFTAHLGSIDEKREVFSKVMGLTIDHVKEALKMSRSKVSCIYFFTLGKVADLRQSMKIPSEFTDDMIVCKYGNTIDLHRRTIEHSNAFSSIKNVDLKLKFYSPIDSEYIFEAETFIKKNFIANKSVLSFEKYTELVAIDPLSMSAVEAQYDILCKTYGSCNKELLVRSEQNKINYQSTEKDIINKLELMKKEHEADLAKKDAEIQIAKKEHELQIEKKNREIEGKDREIERREREIERKDYQMEIMKKDFELEIMKLKLASLSK